MNESLNLMQIAILSLLYWDNENSHITFCQNKWKLTEIHANKTQKCSAKCYNKGHTQPSFNN
jgi:hypothetical protein